MLNQPYGVLIPNSVKPHPQDHEIAAAHILADYFKTTIVFRDTRSVSSPDLDIGGTLWEVKSPIGNSPNNISKNMREASKQSENIVIDLSRSKLHLDRALGYAREYLKRPNCLKRVLVITKSGKVIELK